MITSSWSFSSSSSASSPPVGLSAYYPFPPKDTITHVFTKACHVSTFTFTLQIYFDILRHIKRLFKKKRNSVRSWAFVGEQEMELFFTIHGKKPSKQYAIYVSFLSSSVTLVPDKFVWTASAGVDTTLKGSGNDVFSREFLSGLFMAIQRAFFFFLASLFGNVQTHSTKMGNVKLACQWSAEMASLPFRPRANNPPVPPRT